MLVTDKNYPSKEQFYYYGFIYTDDQPRSVEEIKAINGDYCGVLCRDGQLIAVTDAFRSKSIFYHVDPEYRTFVFTHDPREIQAMGLYPYIMEGNCILTLDLHTFKFSKQENMIWNLDQTDRTYTKVFDAADAAVKMRWDPDNDKVMMTSGHDSGVIACSLHKLGYEKFSVTGLGAPIYMQEHQEVLAQRLIMHKGHIIKIKGEEQNTDPINAMRWERNIDEYYGELVMGVCDWLRTIDRNCIITGNGAFFYDDKGLHGKQFSYESHFGGCYPKDLNHIFPRQTSRIEAMSGSNNMVTLYKGCDHKQPLVDPVLVQAWINTVPDLKNAGYKNWNVEYLKAHDYPNEENFSNGLGGDITDEESLAAGVKASNNYWLEHKQRLHEQH